MMQSRREGFALAATILAMLVVGAIVIVEYMEYVW